VDDDFGIRLSFENVAFPLQERSQLLVVVDLSVEYDPNCAVFVRNWLMASG
jgi:hypothetical protein